MELTRRPLFRGTKNYRKDGSLGKVLPYNREDLTLGRWHPHKSLAWSKVSAISVMEEGVSETGRFMELMAGQLALPN